MLRTASDLAPRGNPVVVTPLRWPPTRTTSIPLCSCSSEDLDEEVGRMNDIIMAYNLDGGDDRI